MVPPMRLICLDMLVVRLNTKLGSLENVYISLYLVILHLYIYLFGVFHIMVKDLVQYKLGHKMTQKIQNITPTERQDLNESPTKWLFIMFEYFHMQLNQSLSHMKEISGEDFICTIQHY